MKNDKFLKKYFCIGKKMKGDDVIILSILDSILDYFINY